MSMAEISLSLARLKISLSAFLGPWPWPFRLGSVCFIPCASSESRFESPGSLAFSFLAYFFRDCKKSSRVFASKYCRIMTSNTEMSLNRLTLLAWAMPQGRPLESYSFDMKGVEKFRANRFNARPNCRGQTCMHNHLQYLQYIKTECFKQLKFDT